MNKMMNGNKWNSIIFIKTDKSWNDMAKMAEWQGVERMWSMGGSEYEWGLMLSSDMSSPEKTEEMVARMHDGHWVTETKTNWWKEVSAK